MGKATDFFEGPSSARAAQNTDIRNKIRFRKADKGRTSTFDDLKVELDKFTQSTRPSIFSNAPARKVRAKIID